jgi:hypothetical protein
VREWRERLAEGCTGAGVRWFSVTTDAPMETLVKDLTEHH